MKVINGVRIEKEEEGIKYKGRKDMMMMVLDRKEEEEGVLKS